MLTIPTDLDIVETVFNDIDTIIYTMNTDVNANNFMKAAYNIVSGEFSKYMTEKSLSEPKKFAHMYEWNLIGDPHSQLWKTQLNGSGKSRTTSFVFLASKTAVPVAAKLRSVGVQQNHIFVWKAMVFEYGLPVQISPKLAKVLVFEAKDTNGGASTNTISSWTRGGIVFFDGSISIQRAGNEEIMGSFTEKYIEWMGSSLPIEKINSLLGPSTVQTISNSLFGRIKSLAQTKRKNKTISIKPIGLDSSFAGTLQTALNRNYSVAAATRRVEQNDE
jgi:hypothetical protein